VAVYYVFLKDCFEAGPSYYPLAGGENKNSSIIRKRVETFFTTAQFPLPAPISPGILTTGLARRYLSLSPKTLFR
jgi:hypothetical protein